MNQTPYAPLNSDPSSYHHRPQQVLDNIVWETNVPYYGSIPNGVIPGTFIIINGKVPNGAKQFHFNLIVGHTVTPQLTMNGDVAFHLNPRFNEGTVIRNTFHNLQWGSEERHPPANPFQIGRDFEAMILVDESNYKVAVNGQHFIEYTHRIPISSVGVLSIDGDVIISRIEYRREFRKPPQSGPLPVPSYGLEPIFNPPLPFNRAFTNGLNPGMMIYISGRVNHNPKGFTINFVCGMSPYNRDIAFHFNPRFNPSVIIRNTLKDNHWQTEERHISYFPFNAGVNFDMIIRVESNRYMVAINGQHFVEYNHRIMPLNIINMLEIDGDISVASVRFG